MKFKESGLLNFEGPVCLQFYSYQVFEANLLCSVTGVENSRVAQSVSLTKGLQNARNACKRHRAVIGKGSQGEG